MESPNTEIIDPQDPDLSPALLAAILGVTRLKASDLQLLVAAELPNGVITLNLAQLSHLYRVSSFCQAIKLDISEYLVLKSIIPIQPLASFDFNSPVRPADTLRFIEAVKLIRKVGFAPEEFDYLLRHQVLSKSTLILSSEEHDSLLKEIQVLIHQQLLDPYPDGVSAKEQFEIKLSRVVDAENLEKAKLIIAGASSQEIPIQEQQDFFDEYLLFFAKTEEAKTKVIDRILADDEDLYDYALRALNQYLIENQVIQHLAKTMILDVDITTALVKDYLMHPMDANISALQVFFEDSFLSADPEPNTLWTSEMFPNQFSALLQLHKLALAITRLRLNAKALEFLMEQGELASLPGLRDLPMVKQDTANPELVSQWLNLCRLVLLDRESFQSDNTVFSILEAAQDTNMDETSYLAFVAEITNWESESLLVLTGTQGFNLNFPTGYQAADWLDAIAKTMKLINRIGATAQQMASWTSSTITKAHADSLRYAAKAKYGEEQWLKVSASLRNTLREQQRDALLNYVLHHERKHDYSIFEDVDDIYSYYLIDPQMAACAMTSRIVLASSSVQLFVQRIMMNLEPDLSLNRKLADEWKWRKYYRVWEANRKVFMWPENWIEPELRDDKTQFFKGLESELLQDEVNEETVERAYTNYLHRLDEVARLTICGMCYDEEEETLHVFGHTAGIPANYFYRRWEKRRYWTPWEEVSLEIRNTEGVEELPKSVILLPVIHNRRLFLFWPIFKPKSVGPTIEEERRLRN